MLPSYLARQIQITQRAPKAALGVGLVCA